PRPGRHRRRSRAALQHALRRTRARAAGRSAAGGAARRNRRRAVGRHGPAALLRRRPADPGRAALLHPSRRLVGDRLRRAGQSARLCAHGLRRKRPVGSQVAAMSLEVPRARAGRAPDVFTPGGWVPMAGFRDEDPVDFAIVGSGAGGATLAAKLAEAGFSVVVFDAGPFWRPLEEFASDEFAQQKLYWTDPRIIDGEDPISLGGNNSGRGVGGSTVHFAMVSLRFRPEHFKTRSRLGYAVDWP